MILHPHESEPALQVTCYSRPKRVAYLVDPDRSTDRELNLIVRSCCRRWGGKFSPIIPTSGSVIAEDWWNLLVAFDPDIVYSLLELNADLVGRILRAIDPARVYESTPADRDPEQSLRIRDNEIEATGIEAIPRLVDARAASIPGTRVLYIKDAYWDDGSDLTFILRNFGVLPRESNMEAVFDGTPHETYDAEKSVLGDFLGIIAPPGLAFRTPLDLAGYYSAPPRLSPTHETDAFAVVVGDSPIDFIHAWNRLLIGTHRWDRGWLWLPTRLLTDSTSLPAICRWLAREVDPHSQPLYLVSCSLDDAILADLATHLQSVAGYPFITRTIQPDAFSFRCEASLPHLDGATATEQVAFYEDRGICTIPRPLFLAPHLPQFGVPGITTEGWMVEAKIQFHPERYRHTTDRPHWQLPKKPGLGQLFFGDGHGAARISASGLPCTEVSAHRSALHLRIPTDHAVVSTWFHSAFIHSNRQHCTPGPRYSEFSVSAEGRRLQGMLALMGGLWDASCILRERVWRTVFEALSGTTTRQKQDTADKCSRAVARALEEAGIAAKGETIEVVGKRIEGRLAVLLHDPVSLTLGGIRQLRGQLLSSGKATKAGQPIATESSTEFHDDLAALVSDGILFQGAETACPNCGYRQWYAIDDLKAQLHCPGCRCQYPLPLTPEWSFKLNELVSACFRSRSILTVIEALANLDSFTQGMFLFLPSLDLFEPGNKDSAAEVDLIGIASGRFFIGEVKPDPERFDFARLTAVAKNLLPDLIILAAPGQPWPPEVRASAASLDDDLKPLGIKVVLTGWAIGPEANQAFITEGFRPR